MSPEQSVINHVKSTGLEIEDIYKRVKQIQRKKIQTQITTEEMLYLYVFDRLIYNIDNRYQRGIAANINRELSVKEFRIILSGGKIRYEEEQIPEESYNQEQNSFGMTIEEQVNKVFNSKRVMGVLI